MTIIKQIIGLCSALLLAFNGMAKESGVVASVNGKPITTVDVLLDTIAAEKRLAKKYSGQERVDKINSLREKALDAIIERTLIYEIYEEKPFTIPNQLVETMIDRIADKFTKGNRDLLKEKVLSSGITLSEFREKAKERVAVELLINEHCYRKLYVTYDTVRKYYEDNLTQFSEDKEYEIQLIRIAGDTNEQVKIRAAECESLLKTADEQTVKELARVYSSDASKNKSGLLGWTRSSDMRDDFVASLIKASPLEWKKIDAEKSVIFLRKLAERGGQRLPFKDVSWKIEKLLLDKKRDSMYNSFISDLKRDAIISYYK